MLNVVVGRIFVEISAWKIPDLHQIIKDIRTLRRAASPSPATSLITGTLKKEIIILGASSTLGHFPGLQDHVLKDVFVSAAMYNSR